MTEKELKQYIKNNFPIENEGCDWKRYNNLKHVVKGHEGDDIISYLSAISNMEGGYLIIGIHDQTFEIVGIKDFYSYTAENIKRVLIADCINLPSEGLAIREETTTDTDKTIWIITIPKHLPKLPVYAHNKAWQRIGDSLVEMTVERRKAILDEMDIPYDWSAEIVQDATLDDLDAEAIAKAKIEFLKRNPTKTADIKAWDDITFLNKAKLTIRNKITRTALILLGKEESEHYLLPSVAKIRWSLKTIANENKDYEIFSIPFLLSVDKLYHKIRNIKYRYVRENTLFPEEMLRYDVFNIREPLNNCIAHQDYTKCARIEVVEFEDDHLVFSNHGQFIPITIENVIEKDCPESVYRNRFLVEAMRNLNMIETEGGGIKKMFINQKIRFFPLPEYDLNNEQVKVTITGRVIDESFANILIHNSDLTLYEIMLLDKVQKHKMLSDDEIKLLKKHKYIEGRKPNFYLAENVVTPTGNTILKAEYITNRNFDDQHFKDLIFEYIKRYGKTDKKAITILIKDKLSPVLSEEQKKSKIQNLLSALRIAGKIEFRDGYWVVK